MKPILYTENETSFVTNGIGVLSDTIRCEVTEERNGSFEAEVDYPVSGMHYSEITCRTILLATPNQIDQPQPFRIYRISKPINGIITIYARHISYDLAGVPVSPFSANNAPAAMAALKDYAVVACPFEFYTDKETSATMAVPTPSAIRSLLGGIQGSVLDTYGGEYRFDRYRVSLLGARGQDNGVTIAYGKNLTDITQEENIEAVYTGAYPYYLGADGTLVTLPEKVVNAEGTYTFTKIMALDLSQEWDEPPTEEQLRARAKSYMKDNSIGTPTVNLRVAFQPLEQTEEYQDIAPIERVALCDTVTVRFEKLGVAATAKCIKTVYDALTEKYVSIELGEARTSIADTIVEQQKQIEQRPSSTQMQAAIGALTAALLGAKGGVVRMLDTDNDGTPDTLYIADNADPTKAKKVWRFNYQGWGASKTGYNGPYTLGATLENGFVADFITAGTLNAALVRVVNLIADNITSGTLKSKKDAQNNTFTIDLDHADMSAQTEVIMNNSKLIGRLRWLGTSMVIEEWDGSKWKQVGSLGAVYGGENVTVESSMRFGRISANRFEIWNQELNRGAQFIRYDEQTQAAAISCSKFAPAGKNELTLDWVRVNKADGGTAWALCGE